MSLRPLNLQNRGICANRNSALALSTGRFVCSLAGDDAYQPERIERQLACFLAQSEQVAAVYSDALVVDAVGRSSGTWFGREARRKQLPPSGRLFGQIARGNFICAPATMVRRSAVDAVGGYDEQLCYADFRGYG
jgi:glycosyltransferase involved in cell wall biosynthesis